MAKNDPCRRTKRSYAQVIWDEPGQSGGNRQKVWAHDLTEDEVESVLA